MTRMLLDGRAVAVTGGASGIGEGISRYCAREGAAVAILDVSAGGARVAEEIEQAGGQAMFLACDVTDPEAVSEGVKAVEYRWGRLYGFVNNAGINADEGLRKLSEGAWSRTMAVNLTGTVNGLRAAALSMVPHHQGSIVNIGSRAWLGWFGQVAYASSKGGVVSATRSAAIELAKHGVRVNCIAPGLIDSPMLRAEPEAVRDRLLKSQPSKSIGSVDDVAWATVFLLSDDSAAITGQVLYVCGGKSLLARPS